MAQFSIECSLYRGGKTKGVFLRGEDLPPGRSERSRIVVALLGCDWIQADGLGGSQMHNSKAMLITKATAASETDIDYSCIQVIPGRGIDDTVPCGNLAAAAACYAVDNGLVKISEPVTRVRMHDQNTKAKVGANISTVADFVNSSGATTKVDLDYYLDHLGQDRKIFPTDKIVVVNGVAVTLVDAAVPLLIMPAVDLGLRGDERFRDLMNMRSIISRMLELRKEVSIAVGWGDRANTLLPKIALVAPPFLGGNLRVIYFTPHVPHTALAVSGAITIAIAALTEGTVAANNAHGVEPAGSKMTSVVLEHPSGLMEIQIEIDWAKLRHKRARVTRNARLIIKGTAFASSEAVIPERFQLV